VTGLLPENEMTVNDGVEGQFTLVAFKRVY
jgi:hypothetical protein